MLGAAGLTTARWLGNRKVEIDVQILQDMLGIWAVQELVLISLADLDPGLSHMNMPAPAELIHSNGPLLPFALIYCAVLLGSSTIQPTIEARRGKAKPKTEEPGK